MRLISLGFACVAVLVGLSAAASAQICRPVSERVRIDDVGCWIVAHASIGKVTQPQVFWHLDVYPTRAAADAARGSRGIVVESYGKVWLFTIEDKGWRPSAGERIAEIGPLSVTANKEYMVQYMEATFNPGMTAPSHEHAGPGGLAHASWRNLFRNARGKVYRTRWGVRRSSFPVGRRCT